MSDNTTTETAKTEEHTPAARRQWLRDNGYVVGDRGRISAEFNKAYDEAHGLA